MLLYRFFRAIIDFILKVFFHFKVRGRNLIPESGGFVLVSNHTSILDPMILGAACPRILNFAARDSLFNNRFFGTLISRVGAFPIKRWSADLNAVKESINRLKKGYGLVIFPEGTRSIDGKLQNITHGFVLLAQRANVPMVPVMISGANKALAKGNKFIRPARISVSFGQPVYVNKGLSNEEIAADIYNRLKALS